MDAGTSAVLVACIAAVPSLLAWFEARKGRKEATRGAAVSSDNKEQIKDLHAVINGQQTARLEETRAAGVAEGHAEEKLVDAERKAEAVVEKKRSQLIQLPK